MRHTLVDYVNAEKTKRRLTAGAAGGGNKNTTQPKVPGQQVKKPQPQMQNDQPPFGAPGTMPQKPPMPGQPAMAGQPPTGMPPKSPLPMPQPPQNVGPYPPTPQAKTFPGQNTPPMPGTPRYPGQAGKPGMNGKPGQQQDDEDTQDDPTQDPEMRNSPAGQAATHVANHVQDPLGSTHTMFQNLGQKQLEYEMEKENARRALLPVKAVLDHVDQMHKLTPEAMMQSPDQAQGYQDPNQPQMNNVPNMAVGNGGGGGLPPNMTQKPGMMQNGKPASAGSNPGASAKPGMANTNGPAQGKVPPKAGVPTAGGGEDPGKPGAPGKKPGKKISMTVEGRGDDYGLRPSRNTTLASAVAMSMLGESVVTTHPSTPVGKGGGGPAVRSTLPGIARTGPTGTGGGGHMPMRSPGMSRLQSKNEDDDDMEAYGTHDGAEKAWDSRGRKGKNDGGEVRGPGVLPGTTTRQLPRSKPTPETDSGEYPESGAYWPRKSK